MKLSKLSHDPAALLDFFEPAAVNQVGEPVMPLLAAEVTPERTA